MAERTLRHDVGRLFLVGLAGPRLESWERAWLKLLRPAGVILFRRNIEEPAATTALLRDASALCATPSLRAVDMEGGLVDRLRDVLAPLPSAAAVAATGKPADARSQGVLIGRASRLLGFNLALAPVLDLALQESAAVMRSRAVSADPDKVAAYANHFLQGLRTKGVLGCAKHFPGLGGGTLDSHHATPRIERDWAQMWDEDLLPYRDLLRQLPLVMVSHAVYPRAARQPDHKLPASVSPFWIGEVLRRRMGFGGLVLSDDLEMGGVLTQMEMEEAAVRAIAAGTDLIEICKDPALVLRAYEAVLTEAERSPSFRTRVRRAAKRVDEHTAKWLDTTLPRNGTAAQIVALKSDIQRFRERVGEVPA